VANADIWDPGAYLRWAYPRTRAVLDLLSHIDQTAPRLVVDLGCGPGNTTELMSDRWPDALVIGVDNSPSMIEAARPRQRPGRLEFRAGDLRDWEPGEPVDVILANAVLQFHPEHLDYLPKWAGFLPPGGEMGIQMPGAPPHPPGDSLMDLAQQLIEAPQWRGKLSGSLQNMYVYPVDDYLTVLTRAGLSAEAWESEYSYPLAGPGSLVQYSAGSVVRPALSLLTSEESERFLAEYAESLRAHHSPRIIGGQPVEFLRQHRVFAVGRRPRDQTS
jgi:trans-aconitate 2-methyltransferase